MENNKKNINLKFVHPFHLVKPSAWPFLLSVNLFYFILVFVTYGIKHGRILPSSTSTYKYHGLEGKSFFSDLPEMLFVKCSPLIKFHIFMSLFFIFIMFSWF